MWVGAGCTPQGLGCTLSRFTCVLTSPRCCCRHQGREVKSPTTVPACQLAGPCAASSPCSEPGQQGHPSPPEGTGLCEDGVRGPWAQALGQRWGTELVQVGLDRSRDRVGCPHGARLAGSRASGAGPWGQGRHLAGNVRTSPLKLTRRMLESTLAPSRGRLGVSASHYGNNPSGSSKAEKRRLEVAPESGGCRHPSCFQGRRVHWVLVAQEGRAARDGVLGSCWLTAASGTARRAQHPLALPQGEEERPRAWPFVCCSVSQCEQRRLRCSGLDGEEQLVQLEAACSVSPVTG